MKRVLVVAAVTLALLAGCAEPAEPKEPTQPGPFGGDFAVSTVTLNDGRRVTCVVFWDGYKAGGLSCDWANAK